jgi:hypothetical protein
MKDDAKFFFFLAGFVGFVLFYLISSLIYKDFIQSLLHGSVGCVFFATSGRFLLGFALSSSRIQDASRQGESSSSPAISSKSNPKEKSISGEDLAAATNVEALTKVKKVSLPKAK